MRLSTPSPPRLLLISFLVLIAVGTLLLKLPAATPEEAPLSWVDALFTATSAACVTGLVVRDTGTAFTPFGQGVILALIQLGGLGVMTFSLFLFGLFRQRLPVVYRPLMEQTLSSLAGGELSVSLRQPFDLLADTTTRAACPVRNVASHRPEPVSRGAVDGVSRFMAEQGQLARCIFGKRKESVRPHISPESVGNPLRNGDKVE